MKVLLIQPPTNFHTSEIIQIAPPLGLLYLGSVSEVEGHSVKILDTIIQDPIKQFIDGLPGYFHYGSSYKKILHSIETFKPDVVGITCPFSLMWNSTVKVAGLVKKYDSQVPVVAGGMHPSAVPDEALSVKNIDYVVIGEGEVTFIELLREIEKGNTYPKDIRGLAFKDKKDITHTLPREPIANLDELPFPARHLVPNDEYIKVAKPLGGLKRQRFTSMITSRGCPGKCMFCSIHITGGHKWRYRSPANVVSEVEHVIQEYDINEIHFVDDNLTLDKKRMMEICNLIIRKKLDITWTTPNGVAIYTLDKELLRSMAKSGCYQLNFGIESGNEEILHKVVKKQICLNHTRKVINWASDLGIWTHGFFIIGLPGETKATIEDTINFAKSSNLDSASFLIAQPHPGTELYELCKSKGYISNDVQYEKIRSQDAIIETELFHPNDLLSLQKRAYREFAWNRMKKEAYSFRMLRRALKSKQDISFALRKAKRLIKVI